MLFVNIKDVIDICYYIVKPDKRITNAININMTKQQLEQQCEQVIDCTLGDKNLQPDYIMIRKLFSAYHIFSDRLKNLIEIYDKEGTNIAMGQTVLSGDGCPLDISISNDGTKLAVSYVYLKNNMARTKVIFYNYSGVGKNEAGRIVGGFENYEESFYLYRSRCRACRGRMHFRR